MKTKPIVTLDKSKHEPSIKCRCPYCGYGPLDGYTHIRMQSRDEAVKNIADLMDPPESEVRPENKNLTICASCQALLMFVNEDNGALSIRKATKEEVGLLQADLEKWKIITHLRKRLRARRRS